MTNMQMYGLWQMEIDAVQVDQRSVTFDSQWWISDSSTLPNRKTLQRQMPILLYVIYERLFIFEFISGNSVHHC